MTIDSPSTVGSVATRMSSIRPAAAAFSEMRPSCGFRRSAMSSFASTFRRVVTPAASRFGMRCISCSTPSMRNRTTSASSCGSKWMSRGAVLGRLEDDRVDEADERGVRDAVVGLEVVASSSSAANASRPPRARRARRRLGRADELADLGQDLVARRRRRARSVSRVASRSSSIAVDVRRVGDRDAQDLALERVRDRDDALEHVQRDELRAPRGRRRSCARSIERQLVARGEHARDALARWRRPRRRAPARASRLRRAAARERELVGRDQAGRGEQVDDELGRSLTAGARQE